MTIIKVRRGTASSLPGQSYSRVLTENLSVQDALVRQRLLKRLGSDSLSLSDDKIASTGAALFPMSFTDPVFANVTNVSSIDLEGGTINDKSIDQTNTSYSMFLGAGTANRIRIRSNECVRKSGNSTTTINWCWLEVYRDDPLDHSDGYQCNGTNETGRNNINNTTFRCRDNAHTGYFSADNWNGPHYFENVFFWGTDTASFGLRLNSDGGTGVSLRNVYFTEDFAIPYEVDIPVIEWTNVRWATVVGGVLVPGAVIPPP